MKATATATINGVFSDYTAESGKLFYRPKVARRGTPTRTLAFIPASHPAYERFKSSSLRAYDANGPVKAVAGILLVEWMVKHSDSLSVTGHYLRSTDRLAPTSVLVAVPALEDGTPDIAAVLANTRLSSAMDHAW